MTAHRWSGWPGAWCLDCGTEDPFEQAIADRVLDPYTSIWSDPKRETVAMAIMRECKEPGSKRNDPYGRKLV